jgi:hypothetical protein
VLTVGAEYSKLFVVVGPFIGHCSVMRGEAAGSIRSRSLKMLVEGNRIENADYIGVTRIGPQGRFHRAAAPVPELLRAVLTPFCGSFLQLARAMLVLTRVENHLRQE